MEFLGFVLGFSITLHVLLLGQSLVDLLVCLGSLSCWNSHFFSFNFLTDDLMFSLGILWYESEFCDCEALRLSRPRGSIAATIHSIPSTMLCRWHGILSIKCCLWLSSTNGLGYSRQTTLSLTYLSITHYSRSPVSCPRLTAQPGTQFWEFLLSVCSKVKLTGMA